MKLERMTRFWRVALLLVGCVLAMPAAAHHILGRPSYALSEDSNTPPSMQVETQIGSYFVTYMVFPAFPQPGEPGRINLYATHLDTGEPFSGQVRFKARDDRWFGGEETVLGVQSPDDAVFRQGFVFRDAGDYIIRAEFEADGEPYTIDFPLRIGKPSPVGPIGIAVAVIFVVLAGVTLLQRKRLLRARIQVGRGEGRA